MAKGQFEYVYGTVNRGRHTEEGNGWICLSESCVYLCPCKIWKLSLYLYVCLSILESSKNRRDKIHFNYVWPMD